MTDRERRIREEIAEHVERLLEQGGTERLLQFIRGELQPKAAAAHLLVHIRDWEADSDAIIEELLEHRLLDRWWIPTGWARRQLDDALPELLLNPILARLLLPEGGERKGQDLYAYMTRNG